jgi:hypothetical protein
MQKRIEGAGVGAVANDVRVPSSWQVRRWAVRGMQQHVDANETVYQFALVIHHKNEYAL